MKSMAQIEIKRKWWMHELYIDGFPQSTWDYRSDWRRILKKTGLLATAEQSVLLLGLGGGDVVKIFSRYQPSTRIVAVEIEPRVVSVAANAFGVCENEYLTIRVADAQTYMRANRTTYDLIIVDLYTGDAVPKFVAQPDFLLHVVSALTPYGHAVFNYASHSFGKSNFTSFETQLQSVFTTVQRHVTWGHTFYIAS